MLTALRASFCIIVQPRVGTDIKNTPEGIPQREYPRGNTPEGIPQREYPRGNTPEGTNKTNEWLFETRSGTHLLISLVLHRTAFLSACKTTRCSAWPRRTSSRLRGRRRRTRSSIHRRFMPAGGRIAQEPANADWANWVLTYSHQEMFYLMCLIY